MPKLDSEYSRTCFVAMPFGQRKVGKKNVDFDEIYREIFRKAIRRVKISDGITLIPKRADDPSHSRLLMHSMIKDVLRSRLMLADVSVDNTNVGAEISMRYGVVPSGTVLVRLQGTRIPFDFAAVQITEYSSAPPDLIPARERITTALRATLEHREIDNPFYEHAQKLARRMGTPHKPTKLADLLVDAELAVRRRDLKTALDKYADAERLEPELASLHQRRATLLIQGGSLGEAKLEIMKALKINQSFFEGRRWLEEIKRGIVPKPAYLDPKSWMAVNAVVVDDVRNKQKHTLMTQITLTPRWRDDGSFKADLMTVAKQPKPYAQIVKNAAPFARVKGGVEMMITIPRPKSMKFSATGKKSSHKNDPEKTARKILEQDALQVVNLDSIRAKRGSRFTGGRGFGGGSRGGFSAL
jgi:hypothetical protein